MSSISIGIDFGTTHSVMAIADSETQFETIKINGLELTPSVVAIDEEERLFFGKEALAPSSNPKWIFHSFKRHLSKPMIPICADKTFNSSKEIFKTPFELTVSFLNYIYNSLVSLLNQDELHIVITIPAYFDDVARQATRDAAKLAGFTVLRILAEPTAAILASKITPDVEGIHAVYDLGGGTFDFSIINISRGIFEVLATGGDIYLGGEDIDSAIIDYWIQQGFTIDHDSRAKARVAREALTSITNWQDQSTSFSLSQTDLEKCSTPFLKKTINIVHNTLNSVDLKDSELKSLILVGGVTHMPFLKKYISNQLNTQVISSTHPDLVVAWGAAVKAMQLQHRHRNTLLDVTPLSLGIEGVNNSVEVIIERNSSIPCSTSQLFTTFFNNQEYIDIHILQGESSLASECRSLAHLKIRVEPMVAGKARIEVSFTLDVDGILCVCAKDMIAVKEYRIEVRPSYGLSIENISTMISNKTA